MAANRLRIINGDCFVGLLVFFPLNSTSLRLTPRFFVVTSASARMFFLLVDVSDKSVIGDTLSLTSSFFCLFFQLPF